MASIQLMHQERSLDIRPIRAGEKFTIGRDFGCEFAIDDPAVSFHHACIESNGKGFLLIDLNSENGTYVNKKYIQSCWLNDGDTIKVGRHALVFSNPERIAVPDKMNESIIETIPMDTERFRGRALKDSPPLHSHSASRSIPSASLRDLSERRPPLRLCEESVSLGSGPTSDIVVQGFWVAKTAGLVNKLEDGWYLSRCGGLSRLRVNGEVVNHPVKLKSLDVISIGKARIQFLVN